MASLYSIRKSRHILKNVYAWFQKKGQTLETPVHTSLEHDLRALDAAVLSNNREDADLLAKKLEAFSEKNIKKSIFDYAKELLFALVFALIIATIVRQMWFEPYEIPTGSMRPTFKEQDHLTVTKTAFGINVPLKTEHLYFDPELMQRTSIVIFSGDGIPLPDTETTYFYLFPYTKRYIKRNMGKPGDSLYFYGGQIYGVDAQGKPITEFLDSPWLKNLEHIPFLSFKGQITSNSNEQYFFHQMHKAVGKVLLSKFHGRTGEVFTGKTWVKDNPLALKEPHDSIQTYSDFMGIKNYAMARLLTKEEISTQQVLDSKNLKEAPLYLEISHTPTLSVIDSENEANLKRADDLISTFKTIIPLDVSHLKKIMDHMYTARFVISDNKATRYSAEGSRFNKSSPVFKDVENGTYEFYFGKAYKIGFGGNATLLDSTHPLYSQNPENIQNLYNLGIEVNTNYKPSLKNQNNFPNRYAYFKNGDLYLLGGVIMEKNDPTLTAFLENEKEKEKNSNAKKTYIGFKDYGPPLKNGEYDKDFIKTFGITIPEKNYLVLGDNHAMSADSRVFGFVPEANMQGAPSIILWPPGDRWGAPAQKPYPLFVFPRLIIWTVVGLILAIWYFINLRNNKKSIFKS
jgi:signal peptidase I